MVVMFDDVFVVKLEMCVDLVDYFLFGCGELVVCVLFCVFGLVVCGDFVEC